MQKLKLVPCPNCKKLVKPVKKSNGKRVRFCSLSCGSYGKFNGRWSGGEKVDNFGYKMIWVPPHERRGRRCEYLREHRLVMERHLKRKLSFNEVVHHKNEDIKDNRIENLEIMSRGKHQTHHMKLLLKFPLKKRAVYRPKSSSPKS